MEGCVPRMTNIAFSAHCCQNLTEQTLDAHLGRIFPESEVRTHTIFEVISISIFFHDDDLTNFCNLNTKYSTFKLHLWKYKQVNIESDFRKGSVSMYIITKTKLFWTFGKNLNSEFQKWQHGICGIIKSHINQHRKTVQKTQASIAWVRFECKRIRFGTKSWSPMYDLGRGRVSQTCITQIPHWSRLDNHR